VPPFVDQPPHVACRERQLEQAVLTHIMTEFVSDSTHDVQPETSLEGVIDSTAIMELVVWVEGTFGFTVELDDITPDNFGSVRQLAQWIARNTDGTGG
jgi:acyl carrier protein